MCNSGFSGDIFPRKTGTVLCNVTPKQISMTLIAIFFPFLSFLLRGKILTAVICFVLQITLIGWIPAAIWAIISLQNARTDQRTEKLIRAVKN